MNMGEIVHSKIYDNIDPGDILLHDFHMLELIDDTETEDESTTEIIGFIGTTLLGIAVDVFIEKFLGRIGRSLKILNKKLDTVDNKNLNRNSSNLPTYDSTMTILKDLDKLRAFFIKAYHSPQDMTINQIERELSKFDLNITPDNDITPANMVSSLAGSLLGYMLVGKIQMGSKIVKLISQAIGGSIGFRIFGKIGKDKSRAIKNRGWDDPDKLKKAGRAYIVLIEKHDEFKKVVNRLKDKKIVIEGSDTKSRKQELQRIKTILGKLLTAYRHTLTMLGKGLAVAVK